MGETQNYDGPDRRKEPHLTDAQIEAIAEKAATKAVKKMTDDAYRAIGKSVTSKFFTVVGVLTLVAVAWLQVTGKVPNSPK
jgi:hypothetical protein